MPETTTTKLPPISRAYRESFLDSEAERLTLPYRRYLAEHGPGPSPGAQLISADRVQAALRANLVAHKSKVRPGELFARFRKSRPDADSTQPDPFAFRVAYEHGRPSGRYLPIDSLMHVAMLTSHDELKRWQNTVSLMYRIAYGEV